MGDDRVKAEASQLLGLFQILPRLVVFDLDYTLWPFYCSRDKKQVEQHLKMLQHITRASIMPLSECRSKREMPSLYPHAKGILHALKDKGVDVAIASRSPTSDIAKTFLNKLGLEDMFVAKEIFSSWTHKTEHFQRIKQRTGIPLNSMLFFDDEYRNIEAVSNMGVTSIYVDNGVNLGALRTGLTKFASNAAGNKKK